MHLLRVLAHSRRPRVWRADRRMRARGANMYAPAEPSTAPNFGHSSRPSGTRSAATHLVRPRPRTRASVRSVRGAAPAPQGLPPLLRLAPAPSSTPGPAGPCSGGGPRTCRASGQQGAHAVSPTCSQGGHGHALSRGTAVRGAGAATSNPHSNAHRKCKCVKCKQSRGHPR